MTRLMAQNAGVDAGGRWADQISLGVLASSVPRDVIDDVVAAAGRQAKRSDGKLPPPVMVYFAMDVELLQQLGVRSLEKGPALVTQVSEVIQRIRPGHREEKA